MNTHPDFEELLRLLEEHHVEYMIVGGYAVAFHGYPRFTKDIDLFFDRREENVAALQKALLAFGFTGSDIPTPAFTTPGNILTFGVEPVRIDLMNEIDGLSYEDARPHKTRGTFGKVQASFIGKEDLLKNKRATPRMRDKGDVEELSGGNDPS